MSRPDPAAREETRSGGVDLRLERVHKSFDTGAEEVEVLRGVDLELEAGASLVVTGPSGCGKSTLLHLIGTLDRPSSGRLTIGGRDPFELDEPRLARFRNEQIGFVFQDHHLLPQYSVVENVLLPTFAFAGGPDRQGRAEELLDRVGLSHRLSHRPGQLSGGERQRVAIARALINDPGLVLCDEPTGNLDRKTAAAVTDLLFELHDELGNLLICVTHSSELAERFPRRCTLVDGRCSAA